MNSLIPVSTPGTPVLLIDRLLCVEGSTLESTLRQIGLQQLALVFCF